MGFRLACDFGRQATTLLCLWVSVGGGATCNAARLTMEVPLDAVAFRGMVRAGRPSGLQGSVAGDVNPRGWVGMCVWSRRGSDVRRSMTRAAAKRMSVIAEKKTRMIELCGLLNIIRQA